MFFQCGVYAGSGRPSRDARRVSPDSADCRFHSTVVEGAFEAPSRASPMSHVFAIDYSNIYRTLEDARTLLYNIKLFKQEQRSGEYTGLQLGS